MVMFRRTIQCYVATALMVCLFTFVVAPSPVNAGSSSMVTLYNEEFGKPIESEDLPRKQPDHPLWTLTSKDPLYLPKVDPLTSNGHMLRLQSYTLAKPVQFTGANAKLFLPFYTTADHAVIQTKFMLHGNEINTLILGAFGSTKMEKYELSQRAGVKDGACVQNGVQSVRIFITSGKLRVNGTDGTSIYTSSTPLTSGKFYTLKVAIDFEKSYYQVYLNGTLASFEKTSGGDSEMIEKLPFYCGYSVKNISSLSFGTSIDDLQIMQEQFAPYPVLTSSNVEVSLTSTLYLSFDHAMNRETLNTSNIELYELSGEKGAMIQPALSYKTEDTLNTMTDYTLNLGTAPLKHGTWYRIKLTSQVKDYIGVSVDPSTSEFDFRTIVLSDVLGNEEASPINAMPVASEDSVEVTEQ